MGDLGVSKPRATALVTLYLTEVSYMSRILMIRNVRKKFSPKENTNIIFWAYITFFTLFYESLIEVIF